MSRSRTLAVCLALGRRRLGAALVAAAMLLSACGDPRPEPPLIGERTTALTAAVEQWRKLVEKHFKKQHVTWGLNIIACESGGNPNAYNASSGASGLFQHLKKYWDARAAAAGFAGHSPFHPEANIAASAYLLYAPGGGPQHWSCKHSPFEDFGYQPKFYDNGVPVKQCTPGCKGDTIVGADCGEGNCAAYGSRCVNDALGVRCVFAFCPAVGKRKVCLDDSKIASCDDGQLSDPGECSAYGAYCSTAGVTDARCVSAFCVASPEDEPKLGETCMPDGRIAHCSSAGALSDARPCPAGTKCVRTATSASCEDPSAPPPPAEPEEPADSGEPEPEIDLQPTGGTPAIEPTPPAPTAQEPSSGATRIEGVGCAVIAREPPAPWFVLLVLLLARRRRHR